MSLINKLNPDAQIGNLTGYIYRSLKNRIINFQKKKQRTVSIENFRDRKDENYLLNTVADEALTEEPNYTNLEPELLHQAISQLRPGVQAVIIATELEQYTFEELSEEWDIPLGTLLSRKHRALSKLHKILLNNK